MQTCLLNPIDHSGPNASCLLLDSWGFWVLQAPVLKPVSFDSHMESLHSLWNPDEHLGHSVSSSSLFLLARPRAAHLQGPITAHLKIPDLGDPTQITFPWASRVVSKPSFYRFNSPSKSSVTIYFHFKIILASCGVM